MLGFILQGFSGATFLPIYCVFREGKDYVVMFKKLGKQLPFANCLNGSHRMGSCFFHHWASTYRLLESPGVFATQQDTLSSFVEKQGRGGVLPCSWLRPPVPKPPSTPCSQSNLQYSANKHHTKFYAALTKPQKDQ